MRKIVFILTVFVLAGVSLGCGKKQQSLEEMQQPMSMETLVTMSTTSPALSETKAASQEKASSAPILGPASVSAGKLDPLPPSGPYKPSANEIQTALKNAGFYTGAIDGKIGPNSKKAITEFQKSNDLVVDGKVGPKTWAVLGKHLNPVMQDTGRSR